LLSAVAILAIILLFAHGCSVDNDKRSVNAATVKRSAAQKPAQSPPVASAPKTPSAPGKPIIIDEPDELLVEIVPVPAAEKKSTKPKASKIPERVLPAYYLDKDNDERTRLTYVAEGGAKNGQYLAATGPLKLDSYEIAAGTKVSGSVTLDANGDRLVLLWIDEANRVIAALDLPAAAPTFSFDMPAGAFGHKHKLVLVRVPKKGEAKVEAVEPFRVTESPNWDDYCVLSTDDSARKIFPTRAVRLELALQRSENPLYLPEFEMTSRKYAKTRDPKEFLRKPPLFDEQAIQNATVSMAKNIAARTSGLSIWSLGDGADLSNQSAPFDYDTSPVTLDVYRLWLQDRYTALKALNTECKTTFKEWSEVFPQSTDSIKARTNPAYSARMTVLKSGDPEGKLERRGDDVVFTLQPKDFHKLENENFTAWADFRAFNDYAFSRLLREFRKQAGKIDARVQTGVLNIQPPSAWGGWEYMNFGKSVDWAEEHRSFVSRELLRSFAPNVHLLTASGDQSAAAVHRLWDRWLRGDIGCVLPPAGDPAQPPLNDIRELANGLTLLRNQARAHVDPIAIYYSPRSTYLHWMFDSEADGSTWLNRDGRADAAHGTTHLQLKSWLLLLEDLGYAPYFITPDDLVSGDAHFPQMKVLILPKLLSLSKSEAEAMRRFVKSGGWVIADGECGTFDGLGKRRDAPGPEGKQPGMLDNDFGIARKNFITQEIDGKFTGDPAASRLVMYNRAGKAIGAESPELRVLEPGVTAAGALAHASTSSNGKAFFSKMLGAGRFFYLNLCLQDYVRLRAEQTAPGFKYNGMTEKEYAEKYGTPTGGEALRLAISDMLDESVGENPLRVKRDSGLPARGLKRMRFDLGNNAAFFAIMPLADAGGDELKPELKGAPLTESLTITAGDSNAYAWYDMRKGEFLGGSAAATVKLEPNRPALLAALPYKAEKLTLSVRRLEPGNIFKVNAELTVAGGTPARHVFHVEVTDALGGVLPYYSANVIAENGACTHTIALAINDPAGAYHVKVRDVLTGKSAEGDLVKEVVDFDKLKYDAAK